MGTVVLDTSVVVALFDPNDAHFLLAQEAVRAHAGSDPDYVVSVIVLAESLVGAARMGTAGLAHARKAIVEAFGGCREVDMQVALAASVLRAQHAWLRLPDALILATAQIERADVVLTADKRWAKVSDKVQVVGRDGRRPGRAG